MAITRYTPFQDLLQMQDRMNRIMEGFTQGKGKQEEIFSGAWLPAVDIYEAQNELVLKADLPEVDNKDVSIRVEDNVLTISGERKWDKDVREENCHRVERAYGTFVRSFTLPHTIDREKIKATFKDGVLKVVLPKREETKPKQINIEVG
jgi:HSP20 family protein